MLIGSLLYGQEGKYNLYFEVEFKEMDMNLFSNGNRSQFSLSSILDSQIFRVATLSYVHILVHEMGHAVVGKLSERSHSHIEVFTDNFGGATIFHNGCSGCASLLAGPLTSMIFSCAQLAASVFVIKYLSRPIGYWLGAGAVIWMAGELLYAFVSGVFRRPGDFNKIASNKFHLLISSALLISTCATGVFVAKKLMNRLNISLQIFPEKKYVYSSFRAS